MHTRIIHAFTITTLLIGVLFVFSGSQNSLEAQITGQGSKIHREPQPVEELMVDAGAFHAAPTVFETSGETSPFAALILGALLILLGLTVHALIVLRKNPVHARLHTQAMQEAKPLIYEYEYWIRIFRNK